MLPACQNWGKRFPKHILLLETMLPANASGNMFPRFARTYANSVGNCLLCPLIWGGWEWVTDYSYVLKIKHTDNQRGMKAVVLSSPWENSPFKDLSNNECCTWFKAVYQTQTSRISLTVYSQGRLYSHCLCICFFLRFAKSVFIQFCMFILEALASLIKVYLCLPNGYLYRRFGRHCCKRKY